MTARGIFAFVFAFVVLPAVALIAQTSCVTLTAAERESIAKDATAIAACQVAGRTCKAQDAGHCRDVYEDCMTERGFRDGGADARSPR